MLLNDEVTKIFPIPNIYSLVIKSYCYYNQMMIFFFVSSAVYFPGMLESLRPCSFWSFMFSINFFWFWSLSRIFLPSSNLFFISRLGEYLSRSSCFFFSSFNAIYFLSSLACLLTRCSFSFLLINHINLPKLTLFPVPALVSTSGWFFRIHRVPRWLTLGISPTSPLIAVYVPHEDRHSISSTLCVNVNTFNSASRLTLSLAYRSFCSMARLALRASSSAYLSLAFSCISRNL